MIKEILQFIEQNLFSMGLVFLLFAILFDDKTLERIRKGKTKRMIFAAIFFYYSFIVIDIIKIILAFLRKI